MPDPGRPVTSAAEVRARWPGAYDDLDDATLLVAARKKYPTGLPTEDPPPPQMDWRPPFSKPSGVAGGDNPLATTGYFQDPLREAKGNAQLLQALPSIAGLGLSMMPIGGPAMGTLAKTALRMLATGGAGATGEAFREKMAGEPANGAAMAQEALTQGGLSAVGGTIDAMGAGLNRAGRSLVTSAVRSGRSTTSGEGFTSTFAGKGAVQNTERLGVTNLNQFADTMKKYGVSVSQQGYDRLSRVADDLFAKLQQTQAGTPQHAAITEELQKVYALGPEIKEVVNNKFGQGGVGSGMTAAGAARGGVTALTTLAGGTAAGLDPQVVAALAVMTGLPAMAINTSPRWRSVAGLALQRSKSLGIPMERALRAIVAEETARGGRRE